MKADEGWRCEGEAAPGPYSTSTARMLLPGTLGNSRSKIFVTFDAGAFVSSAATSVDSSEATASSSKATFFTVDTPFLEELSIARIQSARRVGPAINSPEGASPSWSRIAPKYFELGSAIIFRSSPTEDRNDWM